MKRVLGYYKTRNLSGSLPVKMPKSPFRLYISQIRGTMTTFLGRHSEGGLKMGGALSDANSHRVEWLLLAGLLSILAAGCGAGQNKMFTVGSPSTGVAALVR